MSSSKPFLPTNDEALQVYHKLKLLAHPECAGWFREVYRSKSNVIRCSDNARRSSITSIYFLQDSECRPKWRRLKSDEIFVWLKGSPIRVYVLEGDSLKITILGDPLDQEGRVEDCQLAMPAGAIFNSEIIQSHSYTLLSCLVAPGWEMEDFAICDRQTLIDKYPQYQETIDKF